MRIAVFLECLPNSGGAFQQEFSTIEALTRSRATAHEFVVFTQFKQTREWLLKFGIQSILFKHRGLRLIDRWSGTVFGGAILRRLRSLGLRRLGRHLDALLDDHGIDLAFFNDTTDVAVRISDHPFIITVHDLDHRDHPEFPDSFVDRRFEREERWNSETLSRAIAVVTNSPYIARRISDLYHVDRSRIIELPYVPSYVVRRRAAGDKLTGAEQVRLKYDLPARYIFYPAAFLPFKNHLYLLEGLVELERRHGIALCAVFCGKDYSRKRVERQAQALALMERIRFLKFVPDEDIPALYEAAIAVVVPSYFGPTNLQPIEAIALDRPVICSDLPGCREQMGDAALYCDLSDPANLADHLAALINDQALVHRLREAGRRLAEDIAKMDYGKRLSHVFDNFAYIRRGWAWPEDHT